MAVRKCVFKILSRTVMTASKYLEALSHMCKKFAGTKNYMQCAKATRPISASEGQVSVEFEVTEELTNPNKTLHGGCSATMIDIWTTAACLLTPRGPINTVSVSLNVDFMSPAKLGETVILNGKVLRMGRTKAYTEAEMFRKSDMKMIAKGLHVKEILAK